jgi:hypothetical protein
MHLYALRVVLKLLVPGTPDDVKEKSGTPFKINLENTHPRFVLLIEKEVRSAAWLYSFYSLQS